MSLTALLPAHNEEHGIADAVAALRRQTVAPDRIVVIADNCTDGTVREAMAAGAAVYVTQANKDKKAGALNQYLGLILPTLDAGDLILAQDADSVLAPCWIETAAARLADPAVGAVGGVFHGEPGGGLLGDLQRMEYERYARDLRRTGKVWVLTGTATMARVEVLAAVAALRGRDLPGEPGEVYDRSALTEDMELTLAIKSLGYRLESPDECRVVTEVMRTVPDLWRQRIRWQRGAIENLRTYGWRRVTRAYFGQQALMGLGVTAMALYLSMMLWWATTGQLGWSTPWALIGLTFVAERAVTVWRLGARYRWIAAALMFDLWRDLLLQAVIVRSVADALLRRPEVWAHAEGRG